jgi:myo-inositol-1(or 4)-monophosphatase
VDKEAEEMIISQLKELLPGSGFIAEESENQRAGTYNWIIDPLDGTTNFIHGLPPFSVSIALMEKEETVAGVVYEINLDEIFTAWKNGPARLNGKEITVSAHAKLDKSLVATGFPYKDFSLMAQYMALLDDMMRNSRGVRRLGSAAVDLAYVACGRFDMFYEYGLNPWDVAAGAFIVQQAGGKVSDFSDGGTYLFGDEILATNQNVHDESLKMIRHRMK